MDILRLGTRKTVQYMLDLFNSPEADPLYRTKLMVVGFENVGKTTILDCLFPMTGWMESKGTLVRTRYWFKLQGNVLSKYGSPLDDVPHKNVRTVLENRHWEISTLKHWGIKLTPVASKVSGEVRPIELYCADESSRKEWMSRLRRVCMNEATHGIEINNRVVDHAVTQEYFKGRKGKLELSVWDFAGQHDYYNNHHHFLSARSVFMVLWKISQGEEGLKGLEFWLASLSVRLARSHAQFYGGEGGENGPQEGHKAFSIIVVGTFLDHPSVDQDGYDSRMEKIVAIARGAGILDPINYMEVSCSTLENISTLEGAIYSLCLSHSNMGERVPMTYVSVERTLGDLLSQSRTVVPIVDVRELISPARSEGEVKRALGLLSLWGKCVYFDEPPQLASFVVLDPRFLTKDVLGQLFNPRLVSYFPKGTVRHSDLVHIWTAFKDQPDFWELATTLMNLMEKFEVCFTLKERGGVNQPSFREGSSIIPTMLPELPPYDLGTWWIPFPSAETFNLERWLVFNIVPKELIGRLFVRLHLTAEDYLIWRTGICLRTRNAFLFVSVDLATNVIRVQAREETTDASFLVQMIGDLCRLVSACSLPYPGVSYRQCSPSPHAAGVFISLSDCLNAWELPATEKVTLVCPVTGLPVDPEQLLRSSGLLVDRTVADTRNAATSTAALAAATPTAAAATVAPSKSLRAIKSVLSLELHDGESDGEEEDGLLISPVNASPHLPGSPNPFTATTTSWWDFSPGDSWLQQEGSACQSLAVIEEGRVRSQAFFEKLSVVIGVEQGQLLKGVHAVHHPTLSKNFTALLRILPSRISARRLLSSQSDSFSRMPDAILKSEYINHLHTFGHSFSWNSSLDVSSSNQHPLTKQEKLGMTIFLFFFVVPFFFLFTSWT